jgi:hypothetical protein
MPFRASLAYTPKGLEVKTYALFDQKTGAYHRMDEAIKGLAFLFKEHARTSVNTPNTPISYRTKTPFSSEETNFYCALPFAGLQSPVEEAMWRAEDRIRGHLGLMGEWGNGLGQLILTHRDSYSLQKTDSLINRVRGILSGARSGSQLNRALANGTYDAPVKETSRQAMDRIAADYRRWMQINADVITPEARGLMENHLENYRSALAEIDEWLDYMQGYAGQVEIQQSQRHR